MDRRDARLRRRPRVVVALPLPQLRIAAPVLLLLRFPPLQPLLHRAPG